MVISMFFKMKKMSFKLVLLTLVMASSHSHLHAADKPATDDKGTICIEVDKQIYSSESTDIKDFKATKPGLKNISKQKLKSDKNVTLYIFSPGNIVCAVKK